MTGTARAASFTVTKTADTNDGSCNTDCSLREAVVAANAAAGPDTISVPTGTYALTTSGPGEDASAKGDLDLTDDTTIQGAGSSSTVVSGNDLDRVFDVHRETTVTIQGLTATGGFVENGGGGILNAGHLTLDLSLVSDNIARDDGGGIHNTETGTLFVTRSTIYANEGANGGGLANQGALNVTNSTINDNSSTVGNRGGGGILNFAARRLEVTHATIAENEADGDPGFVGRGDAFANASSAPGTISIKSSILTSPNDGLGTDCFGVSAGTISSGYDIGDASCALTAAGDQAVNPQLGNLAANGGPTQTMLPSSASPAVDKVPPGTNGCGTSLTVDQRGTPRPQGTACDIGAVEVASAQNACIQPPSGMRAWWTFDEGAGPTAADMAGVANTGTHLNAPTPIAGKVAGALRFNGSDEYVAAPNHGELLFGSGSLTIDAWIRTGASQGVRPIVDKRVQNSSAKAVGYTLFLSNGRLALQLANGVKAPSGFSNYVSTANIANGQWRHVAATVARGSSPSIVLYVDGAPVQTFTGASVLGGNLNESGPLWIGRRRPVPTPPFADTYYRGDIDEVELFARALSAAEVKGLFAAGPKGKCKPLTNLDPVPSSDVGIAIGGRRCPNQPYFRYVGGKPDNFAAPPDASYPSPNFFSAPLNPGAQRTYDVATPDQWFGESFNLEERRRVCHAVLEVRVQDNNSLASNDGLTIGQVNGSTFSPLAGQVIHPGTASAVTRAWSFNAAGLTALNTITGAAMPNGSVLDIYLQDDTTIDYLMLWVWYHP